jgi:hypothetical protein
MKNFSDMAALNFFRYIFFVFLCMDLAQERIAFYCTMRENPNDRYYLVCLGIFNCVLLCDYEQSDLMMFS